MKRSIFLTLTAVAVLTANAQAKTPRDLDDLINIRASSGERELEDRGYSYRKTMEIKDSELSYWWSRHDRQCIVVTTKDGRYSSILEQPDSMCDESSHSSSGSRHSSHGDPKDVVGMRKGSGERELEDMGYHYRKMLSLSHGDVEYWWNSREDQCIAINIDDGRYKAVTDQPEAMCDEESRDSDRHHGRVHDAKDVIGMSARSGERELEDLGYRHRKTISLSHGDVDYWWNSRKDHCIAVNYKDDRFIAVTDQPENMCD